MDELSSAIELAIDYASQLRAIQPGHELLKYFSEDESPQLGEEFEKRFWNKPFSPKGKPGYLVNTTVWAGYVVALKKTVEELNKARIEAAISQLDENGHKLHKQALAEGYEDEVCPHAECGAVLLAHHHFILCGIQDCPMVSRQNLNRDGNPKTLLETLVKEDS